ncbi:hypothetical protein BU17DRAFT_63471 [Hysterangium stoloniferum]|nr:hypothetical protein BU17DRAFT_63471 [Hysterangium stoloniferum]
MGEKLVGEEELEGGDGEGDDDGPDVDSNPDLQAGGTSSLVPGIGSQGQHINRHQRGGWRREKDETWGDRVMGGSCFIVGMGDHPLESPQRYYQKTFDYKFYC